MWTGQTFASRHNHGLQPAQAVHAAHIANAILRRGAPEGEAIATASKLVHRDDGGSVDPSQVIGGMAPMVSAMPGMSPANPNMQGLYSEFASLPTEKLQELRARMGNSPYGQIINRALQQRLAQPTAFQQQPQIQPVQVQPQAPIQTQARGGVIRRAIGGGSPMGISMSMAAPWWTRREAYGADQRSGFLAGTTGGRADSITTTSPAGSYIVPADVIAGLGDGNSLAGARVMDEIVRSGPYGSEPQRSREGRGPPRPPPVSERQFEAKGGGIQGGASGYRDVPVALSHGEYAIHPEDMARWGNGDPKRGARVFDRWVVRRRQMDIKKLRSLRGPVKS